MGFNYLRPIPTAAEIHAEIPLREDLARIKEQRDREIRAVCEREDDRFLLIIGPCSADNEEAVCEYVRRLARLQEEVRERLILIPRIYTNKPRTAGVGYKGMMHQPDPEGAPDIAGGIKAIRRMHLRALEESSLSAADEMLYPGNLPYLEDLLSYVAVGARSVENQQHRLTISGMTIPAGMKNPTSGNLGVMLNAIYAAQQPHVFIYNGWEVRTTGNSLTHAVLRGALDADGRSFPNYHYESLTRLAELYMERELHQPLVVVDTNHANSGKQHREQPRIAREVMQNRRQSPLLRDVVRGLMVESYLVEGSQKVYEHTFGRSITDPCLGWEDSERFVCELAEMV